MNNIAEKATLKGFRKARLEEDIKTEISKDKVVRLNIDIEQVKLQKFKMVALKNNTTMKQLLTNYIDNLLLDE